MRAAATICHDNGAVDYPCPGEATMIRIIGRCRQPLSVGWRATAKVSGMAGVSNEIAAQGWGSKAYREWADEHYCFGWSSRPLSLAHAQQAFPLYLPLLPRGTPADFDQLNFIRCSNR
jgi:hypothetical protein